MAQAAHSRGQTAIVTRAVVHGIGFGGASIDYLEAAQAPSMACIEAIRTGLPAHLWTVLSADLGVSPRGLAQWLGIRFVTVAGVVRDGGALTPYAGNALLDVIRLVGRTQAMYVESGSEAPFNAAHWLGDWLVRPQPALGGRRPAALLDTAEGRRVVVRLLEQAHAGAYA